MNGEKPIPVSSVTSFYHLSAPLNSGDMELLSNYEGRVSLVVNMATGDPSTGKELTQLNEWIAALGHCGLSVLVFPCNQFGGLEPFSDIEIPSVIHHIRPGGRFEPQFKVFAKCDVNGCKACPVYEYLRLRQPHPVDNRVIVSRDQMSITWHPVTRHDIFWNYEKFLVNSEGQPVKRYSHKASLELIRKDIESNLRKIPKAVREQLGLSAPENHRLTQTLLKKS